MIAASEIPTLGGIGVDAPLEQIEALLDEVNADRRNRVRVTKWAVTSQGSSTGRKLTGGDRRRKVFDEQFTPVMHLSALAMMDELRLLNGMPSGWLADVTRMIGGELVSVTPNLRTTVGIDWVADSLGKSASRPAVAEYIALTENATAPAAGDTTLTAEIATNGLARAIATYAHTGAATSYTLTKTYTASGAFTAVQKAGLFNAASVGTMPFENTFTATALAINDQLTVTWTINI